MTHKHTEDYITELIALNEERITWDQVNNYVFLGNINGKLIQERWYSARELGMEATTESELTLIDEIYLNVNEQLFSGV